MRVLTGERRCGDSESGPCSPGHRPCPHRPSHAHRPRLTSLVGPTGMRASGDRPCLRKGVVITVTLGATEFPEVWKHLLGWGPE